jgi:hypothetical protein
VPGLPCQATGARPRSIEHTDLPFVIHSMNDDKLCITLLVFP